MKIMYLFILLALLSDNIVGQDTTVSWLRNIDTLDFTMFFNKREIPKDLLKYIEVNKLKEIANPFENYTKGCVGKKGVPSLRLNWIAKDKRNHSVVSISFGGKVHRTCYYYSDQENKKTNINELSFGHLFSKSGNLSFGMASIRIKNKEFEFEGYEEPSPN